MNIFTKSFFLMLAAAGSASANKLNGALRAQVTEANNPPADCVPDTRPQTQSKTAHKTRFRFNYEKSNAVCADAEGVTYEWGMFEDVGNSDDCAQMCTNSVPTSLANVLLGFNFDCADSTCECLYSEGTLTPSNSKEFDSSNYQTRSSKGRGSVTKTVEEKNVYCFKLVGTELTCESLEMFRKTHELVNSFAA